MSAISLCREEEARLARGVERLLQFSRARVLQQSVMEVLLEKEKRDLSSALPPLLALRWNDFFLQPSRARVLQQSVMEILLEKEKRDL